MVYIGDKKIFSRQPTDQAHIIQAQNLFQTTKMTRCVQNGCGNYGNPRKQNYCNHHAKELGIKERDLVREPCIHEHCHDIRHGAGRRDDESRYVDDLELPDGYSIVSRDPIPGDVVLSRVEVTIGYCPYLRNTIARVALVDETTKRALIHFSCDELVYLHYEDFAVIE